jgi:hypothetical protein
MSSPPSPRRLDTVKESVNQDTQFEQSTRYLDANVLLGFGDQEYIFKINRGEIVEIVNDTRFVSWDIAIRAPTDTWEKLFDPSPPPFYQDLRSVWLNHDLTLEGNLFLAIQHWEALKRLTQAIREVDNA